MKFSKSIEKKNVIAMDPLAEVRSVMLLLRASIYPKRRGTGGAVRFPKHSGILRQQPESQAIKLSRSKATAPAQSAICCLEHVHSCDEFTEGG